MLSEDPLQVYLSIALDYTAGDEFLVYQEDVDNKKTIIAPLQITIINQSDRYTEDGLFEMSQLPGFDVDAKFVWIMDPENVCHGNIGVLYSMVPGKTRYCSSRKGSQCVLHPIYTRMGIAFPQMNTRMGGLVLCFLLFDGEAGIFHCGGSTGCALDQ